jgi:hypothetical protein
MIRILLASFVVTSSSACFNTSSDDRAISMDAAAPPDSSPVGTAAGDDDDAATEDLLPFDAHIVLRFETDAPDGLKPDGAWRDLSPSAHAVTLGAGTPVIETVGDSEAKVMVFADDAPVFDIEDTQDLHFGATDDFFVVARTTIEVPLEADTGCTFHYLLGKYAEDDATGLQFRVCAPNTGRQLVGAVSLLVAEAGVAVPDSLQDTLGVVSFGRNESGTRIETYAGDVAFEQTIPPTDVSAPGKPLVVGAARAYDGAILGGHIGRVNRLYVFHAPAGTFTAADFAAIREAVANAGPIP